VVVPLLVVPLLVVLLSRHTVYCVARGFVLYNSISIKHPLFPYSILCSTHLHFNSMHTVLYVANSGSVAQKRRLAPRK
jgi:hypothetical protein